MSDYILETKQLSKHFKKQQVIKDVSLRVQRNSVYGLLGPNGAGKSTTLKLIAGMLHPTAGQIQFAGHPWSRADLNEIGALIERPPLYDNLTARENIQVRTLLLGLPTTRIDEVLELVDLKNTGKKKSGQFSLGMRQRLGIAIALLNKPKLLILDEPTNGLDPIGIQELRHLIQSFPKQGTTVILSSHTLAEVEQVADHIGIITAGELRYQNAIKHEDNLEGIFMKVIQEGRER